MYFYLIIISLINYFFLLVYLRISKKKKILDNKNIGFGYKPTPTGSGIVIIFMFLVTNIYYFFYFDKSFIEMLPNRAYIFYISIIILGVISFIDDFKPISPILRLLTQLTLIFFSLSLLTLYVVEIPMKLKIFLATFAWIYLLNITNFVDGSDGFLSTILVFFFIGVIFCYKYLNLDLDFTYLISFGCIFLIISFMILNKPIAKIYMGDTGSMFFGYIIGFIFLDLYLKYQLWHVVIGLFAYPLADCSKALFIKTIIKKNYPWARMDDYSFLKPVIKNKTNQKYIFNFILTFSFINFLIVILGLILNTKILLILNFLLAFILMRIFEKNKDFRFKNILKINLI